MSIGILDLREVRSFRCVTAASAAEITPHLEAWERLEARALEDNVYLAGPFVRSVFRHLPAPSPQLVVFVYARGPEGERLVGVAAFEILRPTRRRPLATLSTSVGRHGYCTFPLLDRDCAAGALRALWDWIEDGLPRWSLVLVNHVRVPSVSSRLLEAEMQRRGRPMAVRDARQRPTLYQGRSFEQYLASLPPARRKGYRRGWRRLSGAGRVEVALHQDLAGAPDLAERFLRLEALGWKGRAGSALACSPSEAAFFHEITGEFGNRSRLFFVELRLDGRPIAMTSNFVAGERLFAFKGAYDPEFKAVSPGILAEIEGIRLFQDAPGLTSADSGACDSSYTRAYWRDLVEIRSTCVATPRLRSRAYVRLLGLRLRLPKLGRLAASASGGPPSRASAGSLGE
jgi:CelD/BcsL family acetyltransferase involved in cellulose biosynthesis